MLNEANREKLLRLIRLKREEVGTSEENVKQKIIVPLLEVFGHHRNDLDFELRSGRKFIDIYIKGLPADCTVIIDTKSYDQNLNDHIDQIGNYAFQEGALLAIIANGEEFRIYSPMRGYSFRESLFYCVKKECLVKEEEQSTLESYIGRDNLVSRESRTYVRLREEEIVDLRMKIERLHGQFLQQRKELELQLADLAQERSDMEARISRLRDQLNNLDRDKEKEIESLHTQTRLPYSETYDADLGFEDIDLTDEYIDSPNSFVKNGNSVEIVLPQTPKLAWKHRKLITVPKRVRDFFPKKHESFMLHTDVGEIITHMVGGSEEAGEKLGGSYFYKGLRVWYEKHNDLKPGDRLLITRIGDRKYELEIKKQ